MQYHNAGTAGVLSVHQIKSTPVYLKRCKNLLIRLAVTVVKKRWNTSLIRLAVKARGSEV